MVAFGASEWLALSQDRRLLQDYRDYLHERAHLEVGKADGLQAKKGEADGQNGADDDATSGVCGLEDYPGYNDHREDQVRRPAA